MLEPDSWLRSYSYCICTLHQMCDSIRYMYKKNIVLSTIQSSEYMVVGALERVTTCMSTYMYITLLVNCCNRCCSYKPDIRAVGSLKLLHMYTTIYIYPQHITTNYICIYVQWSTVSTTLTPLLDVTIVLRLLDVTEEGYPSADPVIGGLDCLEH